MSKIVFDRVKVELRDKDSNGGPMMAEDAKELLGWQVEQEGKSFGTDFLFWDLEGNKVRLANVPSNRPFRMTLAKRYANEMIRKKWRLNGETVIVDRLGHVQNAQHRLIAVVLAEQMRKTNPTYYKEHFQWWTAIKVDMLIVRGISEKSDVIDTIDLGQKRSLADVLFRRQEFREAEKATQVRLSRILDKALRLAWLRAGGKVVSDAKHLPHSEALDFLEDHPRLVDATLFIFAEEAGTEKRISSVLKSLGYAAGLLYLMGMSKTDPVKYAERGVEALDDKLWAKAEAFWAAFASGADLAKDDPILVARRLVTAMPAGSAQGRDEICGVIVKAFTAWIEGEKVTAADLKVKKGKNDAGKMTLIETPRLGGLDVEREPEEVTEEVAASEDDGETPKKRRKRGQRDWTGEWAWVRDKEPWKGLVKLVKSGIAVVTAEADGKDYPVKVADLCDDLPEPVEA